MEEDSKCFMFFILGVGSTIIASIIISVLSLGKPINDYEYHSLSPMIWMNNNKSPKAEKLREMYQEANKDGYISRWEYNNLLRTFTPIEVEAVELK